MRKASAATKMRAATRGSVRLYKDLTDVERAFANLKDVIDMQIGRAHV